MLSIVDALDDPSLFAPWFHGPSWAVWRAILKGAFALPMTETNLSSSAASPSATRRKSESGSFGSSAGGAPERTALPRSSRPGFAAFEDHEAHPPPRRACDGSSRSLLIETRRGSFCQVRQVLFRPNSDVAWPRRRARR